MSQIIAASSDKSVMMSQVAELRLSRILNQNMSPETVGSVDPAILGSSKNTDSYCLKFHPYSSVVPKLASPLPLGCKSWRHTAIRPYEMPVGKTLKIVKASTPTFLGAGFLFCFQGPQKKVEIPSYPAFTKDFLHPSIGTSGNPAQLSDREMVYG